MVGADLKGFRLSHNEANLAGLFVLEKLDRTSASLFPLVPIFIESIKFSFAAKSKNPRFTQIAMKKKGKP